jgi:hypothetical protein
LIQFDQILIINQRKKKRKQKKNYMHAWRSIILAGEKYYTPATARQRGRELSMAVQ